MLKSFVVFFVLTLGSGQQIEAIGDPIFTSSSRQCQRIAIEQAHDILEDNWKEQHPFVKRITVFCEDAETVAEVGDIN